MVLSWFLGRSGRNAKRCRTKGRPAPTFRPRVEPLEDRFAPAGTFTWRGGLQNFEKDWTKTENWMRAAGTTGAYPGAGGVQDDDVVFDAGSSQHNAELWSNLTIRRLDLANNYTGTFEVLGGVGLTIKHSAGGPPASRFQMNGGNLNLRNGSWLEWH